MRRRIGLRTKLILLLVLLLTAVFAATTVMLVRQNTATLRRNLSEQSTAFAALATKPIGDTFVLYKDSGQIKIRQQIDSFRQLNPTISNVAVVDTTGMVLFSEVQPTTGIDANHAAGLNRVVIRDSRGDLLRVIEPYQDNTGQHSYTLVYDISNESINTNVQNVVRSITALSLVALVMSIVAAYFLIERVFITPLQAVSRMALQVSQGKLDSGLDLERNDEIGDTAVAVHKMAESLKADIKKLQEADAVKSEFMIISSHNLRTPLTSVKGYLEMLQGQKLDPKSTEFLQMAVASTERLGVFAEDMLTVAQLEMGRGDNTELSDLDLTALLQSIGEPVRLLAQEKKLQLKLQLPPAPLMIKANERHLRIAIWSILDNAIKFSDKGGVITLNLMAGTEGAKLTIEDQGTGIAPNEIPKLFTKFHRGTSIMEYNYEGTGLGLYLTKLITEQHGGQIQIDSQLGQGTKVTFTFPLSVT